MNATPTQRLADLLLPTTLADFVQERRAAGRSWRLLARDLFEETDGQVDVTAETLRGWFGSPDRTPADVGSLMSPPGLTATLSPRCSTTAVTPETLIRDTHTLLQAVGVDRSPNWVTKTVRRYLRSTVRGLPFGQVLAAELQITADQRQAMLARSELRYVLEYRDPTGETAARNVDRARRRS